MCVPQVNHPHTPGSCDDVRDFHIFRTVYSVLGYMAYMGISLILIDFTMQATI